MADFGLRFAPERHGLLIRARDSSERIPVQIFTVAYSAPGERRRDAGRSEKTEAYLPNVLT